MTVSVVDGVFNLNGQAAAPAFRKLPVGTEVLFVDIPAEHPLQIVGPSGDSATPGATPVLSYIFSAKGPHSLYCTNHGYMGGENAVAIV